MQIRLNLFVDDTVGGTILTLLLLTRNALGRALADCDPRFAYATYALAGALYARAEAEADEDQPPAPYAYKHLVSSHGPPEPC